ncbi:DNA polymerase IV [candidate division KSB1 bacterium]|nr:DNA polymerase IV [candidate division KSB1 bacterium]
MQRWILHIDMDAFFAAIEQHDQPQWRGKPVVVGADPCQGRGRGVVSTCSYEARVFGIRSAMPISQAYKLCPQAIYVRPRGERYAGVSSQIMSILNEFSPDIEPLSIDEAFLDISSTYKLYKTPQKTGMRLKERIFSQTGLTASVGIAPNKYVAKVASDLKKPDGLVLVPQEGIKEFLSPLEISRLWGVGPKTETTLRQQEINTIGELADYPLPALKKLFGNSYLHFWKLANGIDERKVETRHQAKSMSHETTFLKDCHDGKTLEKTLLMLCDKLSRDLRKHDYSGRTVTLKIRLADFSTFTRSRTLSQFTHDTKMIFQCVMDLFNQFDRKDIAVRLLGVSLSNLEKTGFQLDLFTENRNIDKVLDLVRDKFGKDAIQRASLLNRNNTSEPHK